MTPIRLWSDVYIPITNMTVTALLGSQVFLKRMSLRQSDWSVSFLRSMQGQIIQTAHLMSGCMSLCKLIFWAVFFCCPSTTSGWILVEYLSHLSAFKRSSISLDGSCAQTQLWAVFSGLTASPLLLDSYLCSLWPNNSMSNVIIIPSAGQSNKSNYKDISWPLTGT